METLLTKVREDLTLALKGGEKLRIGVLRFLLAALHNEEILRQKELEEAEILAVIQKQVRLRQEAIEMFKKGGRQDLVDKETQEREILKGYLPEQMPEEND